MVKGDIGVIPPVWPVGPGSPVVPAVEEPVGPVMPALEEPVGPVVPVYVPATVPVGPVGPELDIKLCMMVFVATISAIT